MISIEDSYTVKRIVDHGAFWAYWTTGVLTITTAADQSNNKLRGSQESLSKDAIAWNNGNSGYELLDQSRYETMALGGKQGVDQQG
ncbi:hypothetical protein LB506_007716 [Fusarium annulatum]|nr:hypothetical protein LB506_007716 [Fusarium annulatum]